jgi:hypothetical protein
MASPGARLDAMGHLVTRLWPEGSEPAWPQALTPGSYPAAAGEGRTRLAAEAVRCLRVPGIGRETAVELTVNAVLPVGLASSSWTEESAAQALRSLLSPGTYGKLRRLEGWLGRPFVSAASLQGGLLLHADYCTKGMCGRCPLSSADR